MNNYQSFLSNFSKLQQFKLDKDTVRNFLEFIRDPETARKFNHFTKNYIASVKGSWTISFVTASILSFFTVPPLINSISQSQQLIRKYKQELSQIPFLLQEVNQQRDRYDVLEKYESQLDKFLLNSHRILFFPEVLRQAAAPHQIKLISFRPQEESFDDDFLNIESTPSDEFQDNSFSEDELPGDELLEDSFIDDLDGEFMADDSIDNFSEKSPSIKELSSIQYSLQLEGDYLRMLSFLRDIQSYQSLIGIQTVRFSSSSTGSIDGSSSNASSTGSVLLDMVIQLPTLDK